MESVFKRAYDNLVRAVGEAEWHSIGCSEQTRMIYEEIRRLDLLRARAPVPDGGGRDAVAAEGG